MTVRRSLVTRSRTPTGACTTVSASNAAAQICAVIRPRHLRDQDSTVRSVCSQATRFTNSRGVFDREICGMKSADRRRCSLADRRLADSGVAVAQAMVPPTGMDDANKPMPMVERMNRRFPQPVRVGDLIGLPVLDDTLFDARLRPAGRAHAARQDRTDRLVQPMVRLVRAAGRGADRSRRHRGTASGIARHAAQRIRRRADLARPGRDGAAGRRDDPNRTGPQLSDHDFVKQITFWCFPTCTG